MDIAVRAVLAAVMMTCGAYFLVVRPAQAQTVEVLAERTAGLVQRVTQMEANNLHARLSVVEESLYEVKMTGRMVAGAVTLQVVLAMFEAIKKKRGAK